MTRLNMTDARCEALFASEVQESDAPTPEVLAEVIRRTVRRLGIAGCASRMAQEFGDHPEGAASRMRWIRQLISDVPARPALRPAELVVRPSVPGSGLRAAHARRAAPAGGHRAA